MARPIRKLSIDNDGDESKSQEKIMVVNKNEIKKFVSILKNGNIGLLLDNDKCSSYIDNYLLATVFVYFKRARRRTSGSACTSLMTRRKTRRNSSGNYFHGLSVRTGTRPSPGF